MCVDNINANILCYKNKDYLSDSDLLRKIIIKEEGKKKYINDFKLKIYFNFISNHDSIKRRRNVLDNHGCLKCQIKLEKICGDYSLFLNMINFEIKLPENEDVYFNKTVNVICNTPIYLPEDEAEGNYVFNLMLKRSIEDYEDDDWTLQSVYGVSIKSNDD